MMILSTKDNEGCQKSAYTPASRKIFKNVEISYQ